MSAYHVAGGVLCVLGITMMLPTWVHDIRAWLEADQ